MVDRIFNKAMDILDGGGAADEWGDTAPTV
jgi:hypothetical protein